MLVRTEDASQEVAIPATSRKVHFSQRDRFKTARRSPSDSHQHHQMLEVPTALSRSLSLALARSPRTLCLCVRVKKRESKEPRGEMAYLLQTTSQGHSGRQIKLQPASEGVTHTRRAHTHTHTRTNTHAHILSLTLTESKILPNLVLYPVT